MENLLMMPVLFSLLISHQVSAKTNAPAPDIALPLATAVGEEHKVAPAKAPAKKADVKLPEKKTLEPAKVMAPKESPKKDVKAAASPPAEKLSAELSKLADAIQKHYNDTRSATFNFQQVYLHPFLSGAESTSQSKGDVAYNKSTGSMVWNYVEPKERQKKFYINGNKFTFYSVADKIAYTHNCYDKDTLSASVAFLLGTGNVKDAFVISPFDGVATNKELTWLNLAPKEANAPVKKITLGVTKDGRVVESIVEDPSGGRNHFKFLDFKSNPKIDDSVFSFKPPADVRVQPMPNVECAAKSSTHSKPPEKKATNAPAHAKPPALNAAKTPAPLKPEASTAPKAKEQAKPAPPKPEEKLP